MEELDVEGLLCRSLGYLCRSKDIFPHVDQIKGNMEPAFGTYESFLQQKGNQFQSHLQNKVLLCRKCGKSNGYTLKACNQCHTSLAGVELGHTENAFTGFIYGIKYKISLRYSDEEVLIFDDMLQVSSCHINAIPTKVYIPDWRYLLLNPTEGLKLLEKLEEKGWYCIKTQFLMNEEWKSKYLRDTKELTEEDYKDMYYAGCNYPPSQFQLHLQFLLPPYRPFAWHVAPTMSVNGRGRFCPLSYLKKVLSLSLPFPVLPETPVESIYQFFDLQGVSYDAYYDQHLQKERRMHRRLVNWKVEDFEGIVVVDTPNSTQNQRFYKLKRGEPRELKQEEMELRKELWEKGLGCAAREGEGRNWVLGEEEQVNDWKTLQAEIPIQNYGRPFSGGRPTGSIYPSPKTTPLEPFSKDSKL